MLHNGETLLDIKEAADFLNVKISWLRAAVFRKKIPYIKLNRLLRFSKEELQSWLKSQKIKSKLQCQIPH